MSGEGEKLLMPSLSGWYGPTDPGARVAIMDGSRPRTMERKPVILGEELKAEQGPHGDLSGRISRSLAAALGVTYETFLCLFDRVNLLRHWAANKLPEAASLKVMASGYECRGEPLILVGTQVAAAFKFEAITHVYEWEKLGQAWAVVIPTPGKMWHSDDPTKLQIGEVLERALLYHGKVFRVGQWPNGDGSMVMIGKGEVWGNAAERLKHKAKAES